MMEPLARILHRELHVMFHAQRRHNRDFFALAKAPLITCTKHCFTERLMIIDKLSIEWMSENDGILADQHSIHFSARY